MGDWEAAVVGNFAVACTRRRCVTGKRVGGWGRQGRPGPACSVLTCYGSNKSWLASEKVTLVCPPRSKPPRRRQGEGRCRGGGAEGSRRRRRRVGRPLTGLLWIAPGEGARPVLTCYIWFRSGAWHQEGPWGRTARGSPRHAPRWASLLPQPDASPVVTYSVLRRSSCAGGC